MRRNWLVLGVLLACGPHAGTGVGELRVPEGEHNALQPKGKVTLSWKTGPDISNGEISAALPDGRRFQGTFVQPQRSQWRDNYDLYWGAWTGPWGRAGPWYSGTRGGFTTQYADHVLAHLENGDGTRMRCSFALYQADQGLEGGGQGDCQLSTNEEVFDAVLAKAD
jgi:hypothetical protein